MTMKSQRKAVPWIALVALCLISAGITVAAGADEAPVPVIHVTDLHRPHVDPDDHWDLACVFALAYAGESMRLTTRLMQVASWLLVQRAVREGDMAPESACEDRYRLAAEDVCRNSAESSEDLPPALMILLDRSERLYERVRHLDRRMYVEETEAEAPNPVLTQFDKLRSAFGG